jgi:acyloxyacyl hydrolase
LGFFGEQLIDFDGDHFGTDEQLRGTDWRGRDCNELDSQVHPGRAVNPYPGSGVDYNCNGIHGFTPEGKEWKDQLCEGSGQLGIVTIGGTFIIFANVAIWTDLVAVLDSGGAHFSIPPRYLTASMINDTTYHDLSDVIMDEFDFPQASGYTGFIPHRNVGPVGSIYKKMVGRNHCNHRDYQNLAVNGADSNTTQINMHSLNRTRNDHPVILFLELIGTQLVNQANCVQRRDRWSLMRLHFAVI